MKETMLNSKARLSAFYFSIYVKLTLKNVLNNPMETSELCGLWISFHKMTLKQKVNLDLNLHQDGLLRSYLDRGRALHQMQNYLGAIQSFQRALDVPIALFGEGHPNIAQRYFFLGENQLLVSSSVLSASSWRKVKLFGEEHLDTAQSYFNIGVTSHALSNFSSEFQSLQRALDIRVKLFGEEHPNTALSYFSLGVTQNASGDFSSALQSVQRALEIRVKLSGEEHPDRAQGYFSHGITRYASGDFLSALQSLQCALDIRV